MRHLLLTATAAVALALATPAFADDYVMMKVNNRDVTQSDMETMWNGLSGGNIKFSELKPDMRDKLLRGMMTEKLLLGEAEKQGFDKSAEVEKQLEEIKKKLVVKAFLDKKTSDSLTDADLKREYDNYVSAVRDEKEVRARHILVATEKEAKDVKAKLADGKSFEDVAREYSKDPGSAKQGGDLGYFTKDKMVKEFAEAAFKLKKGDVSDPVKSTFGWHVIKIEDVRKVTVPTFNEAKPALRARLQDKKLGDYIQGLVKSADVKVFDAKGNTVPFTKEIKDAK